MKLYFTADATINPEHSVLLNRIAVDIRKPFTELVESISRQNKDRLDWWISSPASRNTFVSPLFHYCCFIALLQELIREKESLYEIAVDSKALKKILEDYLARQGVNVRVTLSRLPLKQRLKELAWPIYTIFGLPLKHLLLFFAAKSIRSLRKPLLSDPLTLIDTFVMHGYIERDRNYPGLLDALSAKEKERVWFVPFLYGFRSWEYVSVIKQLRRSKRNFILKEDYLKVRDFLFAWGHFLRVRSLKIKPCLFQGVNISRLIQEEIKSFKGMGASYSPLLNYRFAGRLKQANIKLRLVVDWFENQNIDKGWNAGFRRFFPQTLTRGYQGFAATPHYLCMYPTEEEKKNAVIPHEIMVIGKGLERPCRKFCPDLHMLVAPAFRFQKVWQERKYFPALSEHTILVALPVLLNDAIHILNMLVHGKADLNKEIRLWIKPHPATPISVIKKGFGREWPKELELVTGDFSDCVEKSNLLISSASSACLETLAKGIPVIVVGNRHGLTYNPIPGTITEDIWRLCYSPKEIAKVIQCYKNRSQEKIKEHEEAGKKIREEYFEPVTRENVIKFLRMGYMKGLSEFSIF